MTRLMLLIPLCLKASRNMRYSLVSIVIATVLSWAVPVAACVTLDEPQEINQLLTVIESSDMQFIRNGSAYDGKAAREHLQEKLQFAGSRIATAEEFIHYIASKSSLTGEPYHVRFPDGKEMESGVWLSQQLSIIESKECNYESGRDG